MTELSQNKKKISVEARRRIAKIGDFMRDLAFLQEIEKECESEAEKGDSHEDRHS